MYATRLDSFLQARLDRELGTGERVLWTGQPVPSRAAPAALGVVGGLLAALSASAIAVACAVTPLKAAPLLFVVGGYFGVIGLVLILVGVSMRRAARDTVYAITDRRAIAIVPARAGAPATARSFGPAALARMARTENADGSGDLVFGDWPFGRPSRLAPGFVGVADVKRVEELLRATLLR